MSELETFCITLVLFILGDIFWFVLPQYWKYKEKKKKGATTESFREVFDIKIPLFIFGFFLVVWFDVLMYLHFRVIGIICIAISLLVALIGGLEMK